MPSILNEECMNLKRDACCNCVYWDEYNDGIGKCLNPVNTCNEFYTCYFSSYCKEYERSSKDVRKEHNINE